MLRAAELSPVHIDLLRGGLARPTVVGDKLAEAMQLHEAGLAVVTGTRVHRLKTTGDGAVLLSRATRRAGLPFRGVSAAEVNAWLSTLPAPEIR